jgi:hypothetical protein
MADRLGQSSEALDPLPIAAEEVEVAQGGIKGECTFFDELWLIMTEA